MSFWDSSALIPLVLKESKSEFLRERANKTVSSMNVWWGALVECHSAVFRKSRSERWDELKLKKALDNFSLLVESWKEVRPEESVRNESLRLLQLYPLRAGDALQLAAALIWANHRPTGKSFVCLDDRLREAAEREGFSLVPETLFT